MHIPPQSILLCGNCPLLLETRQWVLEMAGHRVIAIDNVAWVGRMVAETSPEWLILCHTLSQFALEQAIVAAVTQKPEIEVLVLTGLLGRVVGEQAGRRQMVTGKPEELLEAVGGLKRLMI